MIQDIINSIFEMSGGLFMLMNVFQILKDKEVKGSHWVPMVFFTVWGVWNLYYYRNLAQNFSAYGAMFTVMVNAIYLYLFLKFKFFRA